VAKRAILIDATDNVANLIGPGEQGEEVVVEGAGKRLECTLADNLPSNHKFAITAIKKGDEVMKYGQRIGRANRDIAVGQHVHVHNIESLRGRGDLGGATGR
jgi:altronate dehydratase small subunit